MKPDTALPAMAPARAAMAGMASIEFRHQQRIMMQTCAPSAAACELHETKDTHLTMHASNEDVHRGAPQHSSMPARGQSTFLAVVLDTLSDAKAEDVVTIDLEGKSSIGDHMVIASGRSHRQVGAIADRLARRLKSEGLGRVRIEGMPGCDWVLIDAGDIIVHVFRPEVRSFYNLEKMWSAGRPSDVLAL